MFEAALGVHLTLPRSLTRSLGILESIKPKRGRLTSIRNPDQETPSALVLLPTNTGASGSW